MKLVRVFGAVVVLLSAVATVEANCGAEKSCGCGPSTPVIMCKPVVCRPNYTKVCNYQRSNCKKVHCDPCNGMGSRPRGKTILVSGPWNGACGNNGCGPAGTTCAAPGPNCGPAGCGPAAATCAAPAACGPAAATCAAPAACGPAAATCAAPAACGPAAATCAAPAACGPAAATCAAPAACGPAAATCAAPVAATCAAPAACGPAPVHCGANVPAANNCGTKSCCKGDPCVIAQLIYDSQTACYARQRRAAIRKLGRFDCSCNPEIMCAFTYGLNDCDERVRAESARQLGCQLKRCPGCMNCKVFDALYCALSDCDAKVRRYAERALKAAGYEVANCVQCTQPAAPTCAAPAGPSCATPVACGSVPAVAPVTTPAPAPAPEVAPAPAPEATPASTSSEPEVYFPSRLKNQQTKVKSGLSNLFGLRG